MKHADGVARLGQAPVYTALAQNTTASESRRKQSKASFTINRIIPNN